MYRCMYNHMYTYKVLTALGRRIDKAVAWTALPKPDAVGELLAGLTADPV